METEPRFEPRPIVSLCRSKDLIERACPPGFGVPVCTVLLQYDRQVKPMLGSVAQASKCPLIYAFDK